MRYWLGWRKLWRRLPPRPVLIAVGGGTVLLGSIGNGLSAAPAITGVSAKRPCWTFMVSAWGSASRIAQHSGRLRPTDDADRQCRVIQ
jgi:hypothetical protein